MLLLSQSILLNSRCKTRVTLQVQQLVEKELHTLSEHLSISRSRCYVMFVFLNLQYCNKALKGYATCVTTHHCEVLGFIPPPSLILELSPFCFLCSVFSTNAFLFFYFFYQQCLSLFGLQVLVTPLVYSFYSWRMSPLFAPEGKLATFICEKQTIESVN